MVDVPGLNTVVGTPQPDVTDAVGELESTQSVERQVELRTGADEEGTQGLDGVTTGLGWPPHEVGPCHVRLGNTTKIFFYY